MSGLKLDSLYQMFGSNEANYPTAYSYRLPVSVQRPAQQSGGFDWGMIFGKLKTRTADYLSDPANLLKLGVGGVGGLAGYFSAREAAKRQKQFDDYRMQLAQQQNARYLAAEAQRAKYDAPRAYASARNAVAQPVVDPNTGEVVFFTDNKLTGEQLPDNTKTIFAAEGGPIGYMSGGTAGQADKIPAMLSDGEFVIPADVVSHLGDGNNKSGALKLYSMMEGVRKHKGAAPKKLPPKSKEKAEEYIK